MNKGIGKPLAKVWTFRCQVYVSASRNAKGTLILTMRDLGVLHPGPAIQHGPEPAPPNPVVPAAAAEPTVPAEPARMEMA